MKWSRYNRVFRSRRHGLMLYNALTNTLMEVDPDFEADLEQIRKDPDGFDFSAHLGAYLEMLKNRVLVQAGEERDLLDLARMRRRAAQYDSSILNLTVMVTERCDFACPYCYEGSKGSLDMQPETRDRLIAFIDRFKPLRHVGITWFGGEPLLRFDLILELNERIAALGIPLDAMIVTNGWGLTGEVCDRLEDLRVGRVQVTVDGPPEVHDRRRVHREHGGTFATIRANLDRLMERWNGQLLIHFNVDESNADTFPATYAYWVNRYPGRKVTVSCGIVDHVEDGPKKFCGAFDRDREIRFHLDHYRDTGGKGLRYFPRRHPQGCIATQKNGFVIGPAGEVYKCWDDAGKRRHSIGSLHTAPQTWDWVLAARYLVGTDPFEQPGCRSCFYLPVCGECPTIWYQHRYEGRAGPPCVNFKDHLPDFLEIHYERSQPGPKTGDAGRETDGSVVAPVPGTFAAGPPAP